MSVAYDASSNSGFKSNVTSASWSHTWSGSNRMLSIDVATLGVTATVSAMTYGGATCTFIGGQTITGGGRVESWRICQDDTGAPATSANAVNVTLSATVSVVGMGVSYTGVGQASPTEVFNSNQGSSTSATVVVTTVANNDWVHASL